MSKEQFYNNRLQQVISYLRNTTAEHITVEKLEHISNFSYRNLQRIFKSKYHESIGAYLTRIKLERAAKLLLFSSDSVKNISHQVGYVTVQALNKGFKKYYGISPLQYRKRKEALLSIETNNTTTNMSFHHLRIETLEAKNVYFKSFKGNYYSHTIDTIWNALEKEALAQKIDSANAECFGIIWDEPIITENIKCNYDACIVIPKSKKVLDHKFKTKIIDSKKYAVFSHIGSYKTIGNTYDKIFGQWLFKTDYEISDAPFLEFYRKHDKHTAIPEEYETEIYIPLKL